MTFNTSLRRRLFYFILAVLPVTCFVVCMIRGVPPLPYFNKAALIDGADTGEFILKNLYAVIYFCFSLFLGSLAIFLSVRIMKQNREKQNIYRAGILFGMFAIISGVWILTDSTFFWVFLDYISYDKILLLSFLSFMMMPILLFECFDQVTHNAVVHISKNLFILNTALFCVLAIVQVDMKVYFLSLILQHILIWFVSLYFIVFYLKRIILRTSTEGLPSAATILIFFLLIVLALVAFAVRYMQAYAVLVAVAFALLLLAVTKIFADRMFSSYKEKMKTDFYKKMAYIDVMSGMYNRNAFDTDCNDICETGSLCFVVFDVNGLKDVNDTLGHETGDQIILAASEIIRDCLSALGKCYRIGGDEFAVICKEIDEKALTAALRRLNETTADYNREHELPLSISYGYAFRTSPEMTSDELFRQADEKMYQCKKARYRAGNIAKTSSNGTPFSRC